MRSAAQELCTSSELHEQPQPGGLHGKAHHTPVTTHSDAPQQAAAKQPRLPPSLDEGSDAQYSPEDIAAIETATELPIDQAVQTAARVERLADDILRMNQQTERTAQPAKRRRPAPVATNATTGSHEPNDSPVTASASPTAPSNSTSGNSTGSEASGRVGMTDAVEPRRSGRAGAGSIDLFSQSEHAAWTEAEHNKTHAKSREVSYEELERQRDAAVAELDQLKDTAKRDRAALVDVFDRVKSSLDDDVDERMVRVAAVTIQTALGEMLSPQQLDGEASTTWSGAALYSGKLGTLNISGTSLHWRPNTAHDTIAPVAVGGSVALSLGDITDVDDDLSSFVVSTRGADYHFDFGTADRPAALALAEMDAAEMTLHAAIDALTRKHEAEAAIVAEAAQLREASTLLTTGSGSDSGVMPKTADPNTTESLVTTTAAKTKPTKRIQAGQKLRDNLRTISKLQSKHKRLEAETQLALLRASDVVKEPTVKKRAQELRTHLFQFGGFNQTKAIVEQFISLPEVSIVLSKPKQTRKQVLWPTHPSLVRHLYLMSRARRLPTQRRHLRCWRCRRPS